jgi:transposase
LSSLEKKQIPEFLWHGPEAYGFRGDVWTCARIAAVIHEELGVHYHKDHVGRLLKELDWTPQMPIIRAVQRDDQVIEYWREWTWPDLYAQARCERRTLVFADESSFYLLPGIVRTYAPRGRTPIIRHKVTRDHLSVMGGMTTVGRVYSLVRHQSLNGLHAIEFLEHLLSVAGDRLLVIWDGSPIHRRVAVKDFVTSTKGKIRLEFLPGYAPDLNPWDEGGWNQLKNVQLRNMTCHDLEELHEEFHLALHRLRQRPTVVQSFFAQAGLTL